MGRWPVPQSRIIGLAQVAIEAFFTQQGDQLLRYKTTISVVTIGFYLSEGRQFHGSVLEVFRGIIVRGGHEGIPVCDLAGSFFDKKGFLKTSVTTGYP